MPDLSSLAASLTEAQRRKLFAMEPTLEPVPVVPTADWWDSPQLYVEIGLDEHWFAVRGMNSPAGETTFTSGFEQLTPLGLALRTYLKGQSDD